MPPRSRNLGSAFAAAVLALACGSCAGEPRVTLRVVPPESLPALQDPVDSDRDGFSDERDPCPKIAEDGAPPSTDDGCPAPAAGQSPERLEQKVEDKSTPGLSSGAKLQ
jgi:hypothetical protein